jgi:cation/acetate symporter
MTNETWTYILVGISFAGYLYIGYMNRVRDTKGFYVAGASIPAFANGAATAADWMSAASFISMAGLISFMGYDGCMYLMGWTGGYVLLSLLLAPYLRKFGKYTVPDFVGDRYYSQSARLVAAICAIFVSFTYVAGQMRGVGVVFSRFLGVEITTGVIIGMVIVAFFSVLGGMKGITWTQVAQYVVLILAYMIPSIAIASSLTGIPIPQFALTFSPIVRDLDAIQLELFGPKNSYIETHRGLLDILAVTLALMCGTAGLPHVIVRFYTTPDVRSARFSGFWALLFIGVLYTTAPALAAFAKFNLINSLQNQPLVAVKNDKGEPVMTAEVPFTDKDGKKEKKPAPVYTIADLNSTRLYEPSPELKAKLGTDLRTGQDINLEWVKKWQGAKLMSFYDKNGDGILKVGVGDIYDFRNDNEVRIDNDIIVLSTPEVAGLSGPIVGLVAAGGLAAALSTASGLLLVISSSLSHDIYFRMINPTATEAQRLMVGRVIILLAIIIAGYFGINPPGFVAEVVAFAFGLACASFFPIILLGIFDKRTNNVGAISGMVVGMVFTVVTILMMRSVQIFGTLEPMMGNFLATAEAGSGISAQGIGTVGMLLNFVITFAVSRMTTPPPQKIQDLVESVRIPKGAGEASAH